MNQQFKTITKWQREVFPHATVESCAAHLKEELDEIIEAHKKVKPINMHHEELDELHAEFADAYILLVGMMDRAGLTLVDLEIAVYEKMRINKQRKWGQPDERGVVKHIDTNELPQS